jgi:hypothetical protein
MGVFARKMLLEKWRPDPCDYRHVRAVLRDIGAVPIGRSAGRGRPITWQLRAEAGPQ